MRTILKLSLCAAAIAAISITVEGATHADTYPMVEGSFKLPGIAGNPFDYRQNDVRVTVETARATEETVPAFFDGVSTWRVRYTPHAEGHYSFKRIELNGKPVQDLLPAPREFTVKGSPTPGFIRIAAADKLRFSFENGAPYFPLGNDVAWRGGPGADVTDLFTKMAAAGENWGRVWMCHWDGKNLDWPASKEGEGYLNLTAARHWDEIVKSAGANGIYFQLTLQHHGQYATMVDPNWNDNPWNKKNGGFLAAPEEFFTNERAIGLTKAKYRYIIARYGWSPSVMAWELFNEVEGTDAGRNRKFTEIAAWHKDMADFIRAQDPYHHLITTSSELGMPGLFDVMDYLQPHSYSPDPMAAIAGIDPAAYGKPVFYGEMGPSSGGQSDPDFVRTILWASIMSRNSGAGQYWFWDQMTPQNLFPICASASGFLKLSGLESMPGLVSIRPDVETKERGAFSFGPGGGWATAAKTHFAIDRTGAVEGAGGMPAYFQGKAHKEMFPSLTFDVDFAVPGDFAVTVGQSAKSGASLALLVDGKLVASREFPSADRDTRANATLHAAVPAGKHVVTLHNSGADWVTLARFELKPYGPALHALGRAGKDYLAAWVYRSDSSLEPLTFPRLVLTGMDAGKYDILFWDPEHGRQSGVGKISIGSVATVKIGLPWDGKSLALFMKKE